MNAGQSRRGIAASTHSLGSLEGTPAVPLALLEADGLPTLRKLLIPDLDSCLMLLGSGCLGPNGSTRRVLPCAVRGCLRLASPKLDSPKGCCACGAGCPRGGIFW